MASDHCRPDLEAFVDLIGREAWQGRIDAIMQAQPAAGVRHSQCGRDVIRRHAIEISIERQRRPGSVAPGAPDRRIARLAAEALRLHAGLSPAGRRRFEARLEQAMHEGQSLFGLFHLLRTAWLHRSRGFEVSFDGFEEDASYDLGLSCGGCDAEVACEHVSAERGRAVHQGAWSRLVDLVDPDLQTWLSVHPGRYLLKMTLPQGLRLVTEGASSPASAGASSGRGCDLAAVHERIKAMLSDRRRADRDDFVVMRLDPLVVASREAGPRVISRLREQFGPETQLSVTVAGDGVFAMAAHAGGESDVPAAVRDRMATAATGRLTGRRPGILAMFIDDIELAEWRRLATDMSLEGEARQFLTTADARHVVTVACTSRHELFHPSCEDGEHRYRNPSFRKPAIEALAPSTVSSSWTA